MIFSTQLPSASENAPRALSALHAAKDIPTFQSRLGLRHPIGIYNLSLTQVASRFLKVIKNHKELLEIHTESADRTLKEQEFLDSLDALLDSLIEHIDDCQNILKCFFSSETDTKYKKIYTNFKLSIRPYRDHIGKIANKIKHNQGRLRLISFLGGNNFSLGYFIEGVNPLGIAGPDEDIHDGGNTAFSISRDFRYHLCGLYFIGTHLAQAVYEVSKTSMKQPHTESNELIALTEIIQGVSNIPPVFFPDEIKKPIPTIKVNSKGVLICCGKIHHERITTPPNSRVQLNFSGDGVTHSFQIPYWNKR